MRKITITILSILLSLNSFSQKGTIRGFVSDKNTGEPIMFCNVSLENTRFGSQTDLNGMYTLSKVPQGKYNIIVSYVGYTKLKKEKGVLRRLRFYWFVVVASIRDSIFNR